MLSSYRSCGHPALSETEVIIFHTDHTSYDILF